MAEDQTKGQRLNFQKPQLSSLIQGGGGQTQQTQQTQQQDTSGQQATGGIFLPGINTVQESTIKPIQSNVVLPGITENKTPTGSITPATNKQVEQGFQQAVRDHVDMESQNDKIWEEMYSAETIPLLKQGIKQTWDATKKFIVRNIKDNYVRNLEQQNRNAERGAKKYGGDASKAIEANNQKIQQAEEKYDKYQTDINDAFAKWVDKKMNKVLADRYNQTTRWKTLKEGDWNNLKYGTKQAFSTSVLPMIPGLVAGLVTKNPKVLQGMVFSTTLPIEDQEAYEDALEYGATKEEATAIGHIAGIINAELESIGDMAQFGGMFKRTIKQGVRRELKKSGMEILMKGLRTWVKGAGTEGLTEGMQEFVKNVLVWSINNDKNVLEGVGESTLYGTILGGGGSTIGAIGSMTEEAEKNAQITERADKEALDYVMQGEERKAQRMQQAKQNMKDKFLNKEKLQTQEENSGLSDINDYTEGRNVGGSKASSEMATEKTVNTFDAEETISENSSHGDRMTSDSFFSTDENGDYIVYDDGNGEQKIYAGSNRFIRDGVEKSQFTELSDKTPYDSELEEYSKNFQRLVEKLSDPKVKGQDFVVIGRTEKGKEVRLSKQALKHIIEDHGKINVNTLLKAINKPTKQRWETTKTEGKNRPYIVLDLGSKNKEFLVGLAPDSWTKNEDTAEYYTVTTSREAGAPKTPARDTRFQLKYEEKGYRPGVAGKNEKSISGKEGVNLRSKLNKQTIKELAEKYGIKVEVIEGMIEILENGKRKGYAYGKYIDQLLTLSEQIKESTAPHELLHAIFDMIDPETKAYLISQVMQSEGWSAKQAEEWLADSFSNFYRTGKIEGAPKSTWGKIKMFFKRVRSFINGLGKWRSQLEEIFTDIIESEGIEDLQGRIDQSNSLNEAKAKMKQRFLEYSKNAQKMQKKAKKSEAKYQEAEDIDPNIQSPRDMVELWGRERVIKKYISEQQKKKALDVSKNILVNDGGRLDGHPYMWMHTNKYSSNIIADFQNAKDSRYKEFSDQGIVVSFFSNNREMSRSYADQKSDLANTKKFKSIEQFNERFDNISQDGSNVDSDWKENGIGKWVRHEYYKKLVKKGDGYVLEEHDLEGHKYKDLETLAKNRGKDADELSEKEIIKAIEDRVTADFITDPDLHLYDDVKIRKENGEYILEMRINKELGRYKSEKEALARGRSDAMMKGVYHYNGIIQNMHNPLVIDKEYYGNESTPNWNRLGTAYDVLMKSPKAKRGLNKIKKKLAELERGYNEIFKDLSKSYEAKKKLQGEREEAVSKMIAEKQETVDYAFDLRDKITANTNGRKKIQNFFKNGGELEKLTPEEANSNIGDGETMQDVWNKAKKMYDDNKEFFEAIKRPDNALTSDWYTSPQVEGFQNYLIKLGEFDAGDTSLFHNVYLNTYGDFFWKLDIDKQLKEKFMTTNDYVFYALNKGGYDGVIFKHISDYGGESPDHIGGDVLATFNSNQFKSWDNADPTDSEFISYQKMEDNEGRRLSPQQAKYFKDSVARVDEDINNPLVRVYHTTTNRIVPFSEFNPVGTDGYRFRDQVVNYYTDDEDMSGSYANQNYKKYDKTAKLYTRADVDKFIKEINEGDYYNYANKEKLNFEIREVGPEAGVGSETKYAGYQKWDMNQIKKLEKVVKQLTPEEFELFNNVGKRGSVRDYIENDTDIKYWDYSNGRGLSEEAQRLEDLNTKIREKLDDLVEKEGISIYDIYDYKKYKKYPNGVFNGMAYKSEKELIRNIENDVEYKINGPKNYQYDGYVNITNPLIVDAEGRNWNTVRQGTVLIDDVMDIWNKKSEAEKNSIIQTVKDAKAEFEEGQEEEGWDWYSYTEWNEGLKDAMAKVFPDKVMLELGALNEMYYADLAEQMVDVILGGVEREEVAKFIAKNIDDADAETTNDVVISTIKSNKAGETNYDGIIIKNVVDYGGKSNKNPSPHNLYVTFASKQFKSVYNENPTEDEDIRYQLSDDLESEAFKKRFGNSKVVNEDGSPLVVYHGTPNGEFWSFDKRKASVEGDRGAGFYFTDNEYDVGNNYVGGGPDFDNKVARLAERIEQDEGISYEEAKEKAREQLYIGENQIDAVLKIENPVRVGEDATDIIGEWRDNSVEEYNKEDFDNEDDYYRALDDAIANALDDIHRAIWNIGLDYGIDDAIQKVDERFLQNDYGTAQQLKDYLNDGSLETMMGDQYANNEVARAVLEGLGYDGIIDNSVSEKFRNMGLDYGTTHYIVFEPNQIKSATDNKGTYDPNYNDIRYQIAEYDYDENGRRTNLKFGEDNSEFDPSIFDRSREDQMDADKENEKSSPFYNAWVRYNAQNYKDDQLTLEEFINEISKRGDKEQEIYDQKMRDIGEAQNDPQLLDLQLRAVKLMEEEGKVGKKFGKNVSKEVRDRQQREVESKREKLVQDIVDYMYPGLKTEEITYDMQKDADQKEAEWEMLGREDIEEKLKYFKKDKNGNREAKEIKVENPDIKLEKILSSGKWEEIFTPVDRVIEWKTPQGQKGRIDRLKEPAKYKRFFEKIYDPKTKTKVEVKDVTKEVRALEKYRADEEAEKARKKKERQEAFAKKQQEEYKKLVRMKAFQRIIDMQWLEKYPFLSEDEIKTRYGFTDEEWKKITEQDEIKLPKKRGDRAISDFNKAVYSQVKALKEGLTWQNNMKQREAEKNLGEIGEIDIDVLLGRDEEKGQKEVEEFEKIAKEEKKKTKKEKTKRLEQAREDVTKVEIDKERENSKSEKERIDRLIKSTKTDRTVRGSVKQFTSDILTPVSTKIRNISKKIHMEVMRYFQNKDILTNTRLKEVDPFLKAMGKIRKENPVRFMDIWVALANRNIGYANGLLEEYGVKVPTKLLDTIYDEAEDVGLNINYLGSYYPLSVKAPKSFLEELMKINKGDIASQIEERIRKESQKKGGPLEESEITAIINEVIAGEDKGPDVNTGNKHLKKRNTEIRWTPKMLEYCDDPISTLISYIEGMTQSIERAKFLGKSRSGNVHTLADYVYNAKNGLTPDQQDELMDLLKAVFNDESPNKFIQTWRDLGTLTTLGSPSSTLTQLGDLSFSVYENGWRETLKAVRDIFASRGAFNLVDMGVLNRGEEYTNINSQRNLLQKAIHNVFKLTFFSTFDTFGKSTYIQSTWRKRQKRAKQGEKGDAQFRKDIMKWTDDEFMTDKIINDIKQGRFSQEVALLMYMKLSNIQPLTKAQMPKVYLNNPNGRLFYQFKTFGIKQLDYVLQETKEQTKNFKNLSTIDKFLKIAQVANMVFIMTLLGVGADELKDLTMRRRSNSLILRWLMGEKVGSEQIWEKMADNVLKLFGLSRYTIMQMKTDPVDAITSVFTTLPATNLVNYPFKDIYKAFKDDGSINWKTASSYQLIPLVGKYRYWIFGGGQEKQKEALKKSKKKKKSGGSLL